MSEKRRESLLPGLMTGILAVMLLGVIAAALQLQGTTVPANLIGLPHGQIPEMSRGGPGLERHGPVLLPAAFFGLCIVAFLSSAIALGARRNGRIGRAGWWIFLGFLVTAAVFVLIMWSYRSYITESPHDLFLALPLPTALMIYGLWSAPLVFTLVYVLGFRRWVLTEQDEEKFRKIIEASKQRDPASIT